MFKFLILLSSLLACSTNLQQKPILGTWVSKAKDYTFSITLIERGGKILGKYCSVLDDGATINCDVDDDFQALVGSVTKNGVLLSYTCYYDEKIKASVFLKRISDDAIEWKIINPIKNKEYLVPVIDTLLRK